MSHLYKVETNVNREEYYVIAYDMNDAEDKIRYHLSDTYTDIIITNLSHVANTPNVNTDKNLKYQYKLVL